MRDPVKAYQKRMDAIQKNIDALKASIAEQPRPAPSSRSWRTRRGSSPIWPNCAPSMTPRSPTRRPAQEVRGAAGADPGPGEGPAVAGGKELLEQYQTAADDPAFRRLQEGKDRDEKALAALDAAKPLPSPSRPRTADWDDFDEMVRKSAGASGVLEGVSGEVRRAMRFLTASWRCTRNGVAGSAGGKRGHGLEERGRGAAVPLSHPPAWRPSRPRTEGCATATAPWRSPWPAARQGGGLPGLSGLARPSRPDRDGLRREGPALQAPVPALLGRRGGGGESEWIYEEIALVPAGKQGFWVLEFESPSPARQRSPRAWRSGRSSWRASA